VDDLVAGRELGLRRQPINPKGFVPQNTIAGAAHHPPGLSRNPPSFRATWSFD